MFICRNIEGVHGRESLGTPALNSNKMTR